MPAATTDAPPYRTRALDRPDAVERELPGELSGPFRPYLAYFAREQLRSGGEVRLLERDGRVAGLLLLDPVERLGTLFTEDPELAGQVAGSLHGLGLFAPFPLAAHAEPFRLLRGPAGPEDAAYPFRHAVRRTRPEEYPRVGRLLHEIEGRLNPRWLEGAPPSEGCLQVEYGGELAGAGWVSVVGAHARLHSLAVRPRYRRLGIATDLVRARKIWAYQHGARSVLSEIAAGNTGSLVPTERAGLSAIGEIFLTRLT